jgi:type II secretory pathway pseudopilin PulG
MKTTTTIRMLVLALLSLSLAGLCPQRTWAVTDEEFKTMQQQMQQQSQQIQELQKAHEEDQKQIQNLKEQVGQTQQKTEEAQKTATETQKKLEETQKTASEAAAAAKLQPVAPVPSEEASATRNFFIAGGMDAMYQKSEGENGSFLLSHFNPILFFRATDNVLAEGSLEMSVQDNGDTEVNLEYATLDYMFNDYVTFLAGRFLLPLGVVREKLDPSWIDKLPLQPLPEADATAIIPENEIGVQARGAFHLSDPTVLTYALYVSNGQADDGTGNAFFGAGRDNNGDPSGGGRLAIFHSWEANHDVEVGISGQTGPWTDNGNKFWSAFAVDGALHLTPNFEARGEFIKTWQENLAAPTTNREGWWLQGAYSLAGLNLDWPMINSLEAVFRYNGEHLPGGHVHEYDLGLNYHVTNTLIVKGAYSFFQSNLHDFVTPDGDTIDLNEDMFTLQVAYGF